MKRHIVPKRRQHWRGISPRGNDGAGDDARTARCEHSCTARAANWRVVMTLSVRTFGTMYGTRRRRERVLVQAADLRASGGVPKVSPLVIMLGIALLVLAAADLVMML